MSDSIKVGFVVPKSALDLFQAMYKLIDGIASKKSLIALAAEELPALVKEYGELQDLPVDVAAHPDQVEALGAIYAEASVNRLLGKTVTLPEAV